MKKRGIDRKLWFVTGTVVVLLVLIAGYAWNRYRNDSKKNITSTSTIDEKPAPAADNKPNNNRKTSSTPSPTLNTTPVPTPSSSATSGSASYTVQIVSANVNNGNLHVGTLVSGTTGGSCILTATQSGQNTLQLGTSSVKQDVNNYDCGVFNIPTSSFPSSGSWKLTLTVTDNGASASGDTTVNI